MRWIDRDPDRHRCDRWEVSVAFPDLVWTDVDAGGWDGVLPLWPFDRSAPTGLTELTGGDGLRVEVRYPQAYPMVPPVIRALDPEPDFREWVAHGWHVNGDGTLCLLLTMSLWDPQSSIVELLLKAAAWRIEYALMKVGAINAMTTSGIVSDASLDELITEWSIQSRIADQ